MIGKRAETVLNRSVRNAIEREHEYFTLEHVLWSLLEEEDIQELVRACSGNAEKLRAALEQYLDKEVPKAPKGGETTDHPVATLSIQRLIQRALMHVQSAGKDEIMPVDLFVALFQFKDSQALYQLTQQGVERLDVLSYVSHGVRKDADKPEEAPTEGGATREGANADPLELYTTNLNELSSKGKIDPLIGRQLEIERMVQTLCRRRKNNPLLVGEAGVGKTALAEGLALRITGGDVPELLKNAVVYTLDLGSLLAGAKFRGDFEQRLKRVLKALEAKRARGQQPVLFIDEIHTLVGAGAVSGGVLDAANLLKPLLTRGEIKCIGSTTFTEYRSIFEKDHALARRFQKIDIVEPSVEDSVQILQGLKSKFEEHHEVTYTNEAIRAAVELSSKHLTDRFLPDKAIDVIDEVGAKARLSGLKKIDVTQIEEVISQIARIPARSVSTSQKSRLKNLERDLKLTIFGQDSAIDALTTSIRLARSGLRSGDKPVGCFLFCGPTGVGKTELSKQLAHCLGVPFLRFDMSEYGEKHTVSRLIGAPPGYVGFEQAGMLTDAVLKSPHSVVLLDEIEKAHADIWNILLQVMDHGTLTDNNGRKADFRNVILLMTSNVGSHDLERRSLGIAPEASKGSNASRAVEQTFSPEFRNRLDAIVYFNPLDPQTVAQVVSKQLMELETLLLSKNVEIEFTQELRDWLGKKGYDRQMGARPMSRLIQDQLKKPLAEEILFGKLENGGHVVAKLVDDRPEFEITPAQPRPKKAEASSTESEPVTPGSSRD